MQKLKNKMKTNSTTCVVFLLLVIVLTVSCRKDSVTLNSTFSAVEKCMEARPDSALKLLKAIPEPEELSGKSQADYALLMTQVMDKNFIKFSSDSLINIALNYYTVDQRNPLMYAKTQFYYGRVLAELNNQEDALKAFLAAKEIYDDTKEIKMQALISDEIGMINRKQEFYKDAMNNFQSSLGLYKQIKDTVCIVNAYQNIARVYLFENEMDSSARYFDKALTIAKEKGYKSEASILQELGVMYRSYENYPKAEHYLLASLAKETDRENRYLYCLSIGFLYLIMDKIDDARSYLNKSIGAFNLYTNIDAYNCFCLLEKEEGNFRDALMYREKADSVHNIAEEINSREQIADLQKKYDNEKLQNENLQIKVRYTHSIILGLIAFMIALSFTGYYYYKNKNNKKRIAETESQIRRNEADIDRYQREIADILNSNEQLKELKEEHRIKIGELNGKIMVLSSQNKSLNQQLVNLGGEVQYTVKTEYHIPTFRLMLALKEGTYNGKLSNEETEKLLSLFDFLYMNFVSRLRGLCDSLTKHDLEICCLMKLGLSHEELSSIFNTTSDSVTRAKTRLKRRLSLSSTDDLELFLRNF